MKKLTWITGFLATLMIICAALGALCGAVVTKAQDPLFYGSESRNAVMDAMGFTSEEEVTAYIGLDGRQQDDLAGQLANCMRREHDAFDVELLNEKEQQHMRDVHGLVQCAQQVSNLCMTLAAGLAVVIAWTGAQQKRLSVLWGVLLGLLVVATIAVLAYVMLGTQGFEAMFVGMHELLFTNDLWLMNPQTDVLIRMMPQLLFERAAQAIALKAVGSFAVMAAMLGAIYGIFGNMIRRYLIKA